MANNQLTFGDTAPGEQRRSSLQAGLSWIMVLLVILVASVGFTLDHVLAIVP
jgi:hypothetical protein